MPTFSVRVTTSSNNACLRPRRDANCLRNKLTGYQHCSDRYRVFGECTQQCTMNLKTTIFTEQNVTNTFLFLLFRFFSTVKSIARIFTSQPSLGKCVNLTSRQSVCPYSPALTSLLGLRISPYLQRIKSLDVAFTDSDYFHSTISTHMYILD